jgi:quinol monooxygenase YgiN
MIHIIAVITAKSGRREDILELVRANLSLVRAERGCIEYSPVIDMEKSPAKFGDDTFVVVEKWQDEAALAGHRTAVHIAAYAAASKDLIESRSIYLLQTLPME